MNLRNDPQYLKSFQYRTTKNLESRIRLHELYSTNQEDWVSFVHDQIKRSGSISILEVGCGSGNLWNKNIDIVIPFKRLILSDFSFGMLKGFSLNKKNLKIDNFSANDVQCLPFPDETFDLVIANHMLYHVPDIDLALGEISRVLTPIGVLFAATNGNNHMQELDLLMKKIVPDSQEIYKISSKFSLENARSFLDKHFKETKLIPYPGMLVIPEVEPIMNYIISIWGNFISDLQLKSIQDEIESIIRTQKNFIIHKSTGLFVSKVDK
jgi:ubiquinone/menaquinone biosynthesis C-methylase UbiE